MFAALLPLLIGIAAVISVVVFGAIAQRRHSYIVPEGHVGLLHRHGKYVRVLSPGGMLFGDADSATNAWTCG